MDAHAVLVLFSLIPLITPKLPSVRGVHLMCPCSAARDVLLMLVPAKFTGYQYGGRPLGLTYVKYQNPNGAEAMEGQEETGGMTQDQIM